MNVFLHCLPPETAGQRFILPNPVAAPLVLCNVCRKWRSVATSTPELWLSIHVEVTLGRDLRNVVKGVALWLSRSGTRPLRISFTWNGRPERVGHMIPEQLPPWVKPNPILELFFLVINRWEIIRFDFSGRFDSSLLTDFLGKQSPMLRRFEFYLKPERCPYPHHKLTYPVLCEYITFISGCMA
jgi:hypothetical protein